MLGPVRPLADRMTPAVHAAEKARISYSVRSYAHDPSADSFAMEAAAALGIDPWRVFKTLVVMLNDDTRQLVVAVVPAACQLDLKGLARVAGAKQARMADARDAQRTTGYVVGGISPLGQRRRLPLFLDATARNYETIFVSGGRRGLELELLPEDLLDLTGGRCAELARDAVNR